MLFVIVFFMLAVWLHCTMFTFEYSFIHHSLIHFYCKK